MTFSLLFAWIFVQAVLHKEFVEAHSDKLLAAGKKVKAPHGSGAL
jgi:hypothetical protein